MTKEFSTPEAERDYRKFKAANDKKYRMRTLDDLGLHKKTREKVEAWLQEWLTLFEEQANHKEAWVYRCDFEKSDFFWFTNCKDILEKDPEAKGQENNLAIRSRKRKVMMQLFLKTLLGRKLGLITITCNHCGYRGCWIEGLKDGNGHWVYCPKCKKTDVHVFPEGYDTCMDKIKDEIEKWTPYFQERLALPANCKGFLKEIQEYKYEHGKKIATHANPSTLIISDGCLKAAKCKGKVEKEWSTCRKCGVSAEKVPFTNAYGLCDNCFFKAAEGKTKCTTCGATGVPFDYSVDTCNDCYYKENE